MKRIAGILVIVFLFTGCSNNDANLDAAMDLRTQLMHAQCCSFDAVITAEYDDLIYTFKLICNADSSGMLTFTVTEPESISGISGSISENGAALTFDDQVLAFPLLADGLVSPVSAPWLFIKTLRSGYLSGCGETEEGLLITMDDSYNENPLHLEIHTDSNMLPICAEIYWQQRRVITLDIQNFSVQ